MKISKRDRLILINQYRLLANLNKDGDVPNSVAGLGWWS